MKVWTFEQIGNVLKVAGDKKCQEAQACLEGMGTINIFVILFCYFFQTHCTVESREHGQNLYTVHVQL